MATLAQLMSGLQTRLDAVPSLTGRTYDFWPQSISPPCGWVWLPVIDGYDEEFGDNVLAYSFPVYVMVGSQVDRAAQTAMSGYVAPTGTESLRAAVDADPTLGYAGVTATVADFRPTTMEEAATLNAVGGVWTVKVIG